MPLYLIGTGIAFDLTLSAIDALKQCDEVYIEKYTNPISDDRIAALGKIIGKKITLLERDNVESDFLIERAEKAKIALLASGDPLTATTHTTLLIEAKAKRIETKVIHNSSIYTAAPGKSGLQIYRFGKTATLVNPRPNYTPTSALDVIRKNLENNMHTLVLLDTEPEPMEAKAAIKQLGEFEHAVVLSRLGERNEKIVYGKVKDLAKHPDLGVAPFSIIIPAKLHIVEEEFLKQIEVK